MAKTFDVIIICKICRSADVEIYLPKTQFGVVVKGHCNKCNNEDLL